MATQGDGKEDLLAPMDDDLALIQWGPNNSTNVATTVDDSSLLHAAARSLRLHELQRLLDTPPLTSVLVDTHDKTVLHVLLMRLQTHWNAAARAGRHRDPSTRFVLHLVISLLNNLPTQNQAQQDSTNASATATTTTAAAAYILLPDKQGFTSLEYALSLGDLGLFALLFEAVGPKATEPFLLALARAAITSNRFELVSYLGSKVAACDYPAISLATLLVLAIDGQKEQALKALLGIPAFVAAINVVNNKGVRALEAALAFYKDGSSGDQLQIKIVRYLLMKGASAVDRLSPPHHVNTHNNNNVANVDNYFALAAGYGQVDVLRALVEAARDPIVAPVVEKKRSPLSVKEKSAVVDSIPLQTFHLGQYCFSSNPLVSCIRGGHVACLEYLLVHTKFVTLRNQPEGHHHHQGGLTPLAAAAQSGSLAAVTLLLKHGADPGYRIDTGLWQPSYAEGEALVRASATKMDAALHTARAAGTRRSHADALATITAQISSLHQRSFSIRDALELVSMTCKYTILQMGSLNPSIKTFVVKILAVLKAAKALVTTKKLNIKSDWAKLLFGSPSLFKHMTAFLETAHTIVRQKLIGPSINGDSDIDVQEVLRAVEGALETEKAQRFKWSVEVKSKRGKALLKLLVDWCVWVKEAYLCCATKQEQETAAETRILMKDAAPLLALYCSYQEYTTHLYRFLKIPRFTLACNYILRALPKYPGFKVVTSNAAAIWTELSSKEYKQGTAQWTPAIQFIAPSLRDHTRDWWWDVAESSDWALLDKLIPTIFRYEPDIETLLCRAAAVQPPPSAIVLEFARHGLAAGKSDALLFDSVKRVDCDSFLVLLLTGLFEDQDDSTGSLWSKLRATLEWNMHHGEFSEMHSCTTNIGKEQRRIVKQGVGIADLRSPAAPSSLDEKATVIAGVIESSSRLSRRTEVPPPQVLSSQSESRLKRKVFHGVLFCGLPLSIAEKSAYLGSENVQDRVKSHARRLWCCLSPSHRLGAVVSVECLAKPEANMEAHASAILGLHGQVLPTLYTRWAFVKHFSCQPKYENVFDRFCVMGRFLAMPRLPSGVLLYAHGELISALARNNNPAMARCLLSALQNRGMCCANAPLPFCQGESLCTLATKAASSSALKVYLKSLTTCPQFRGGLKDRCGMGHASQETPAPATMTRKTLGEDLIEIDVLTLLTSLEDSAQKRLLEAKRRLESMCYVLGRGAAVEPLEVVLQLTRNASALIHLSVPVRDLLTLNSENLRADMAAGMKAAVKVCGLHDEASLQQFILAMRTKPLATCCDIILSLQREATQQDYGWGSGLESVSSDDSSESSFMLWSRFCASFEGLSGDAGRRVCDWIVCLQEMSLLNANAELVDWLREFSDERAGDVEWLGAAERIVSEMVRAEEEVAEVEGLRDIVTQNLSGLPTSVCESGFIPVALLPLVCLDGNDVRRLLMHASERNSDVDGAARHGQYSFGSLLESTYKALLGSRFAPLHALSFSSAYAYMGEIFTQLTSVHGHHSNSNRDMTALEISSLDLAISQLEAAVKEEGTAMLDAPRSHIRGHKTMWEAQFALLETKVVMNLAVAARAVCCSLQIRERRRRSLSMSVAQEAQTPLLAAIRCGRPSIVRDIIDSQVFHRLFSHSDEYTQLDCSLCIAAAASGNPDIMAQILALAASHVSNAGSRLKISGWTPIHAVLTGCHSLQEALSHTALTRSGLSLGCTAGMTRPAGVWSVGNWSMLSKAPGLNILRMKTLRLCLEISDFFDLSELANTTASASFLPSVLDLAAAGGYFSAVQYMLNNGILSGLAAIPSTASTSTSLFLHASALAGNHNVFQFLSKQLEAAISIRDTNGATYRSTIRLLHRMVTSTRTFCPPPLNVDIESGTRRRKWRPKRPQETQEDQDCPSGPSVFEVMVPASDAAGPTPAAFTTTATSSSSSSSTESRQSYRHSILHDAIVSGGSRAKLIIEEVLALTLSVFDEYHGSSKDKDDGGDMSPTRRQYAALPGYHVSSLLLYACYMGDAELLTVLLAPPWELNPEAGGVLPFRFVDGFVWTPLQIAAFRGQARCVQVLLETRRCLSAGLSTSLALAVRIGADECAALLAREILITYSGQEMGCIPAILQAAPSTAQHLLRGCAEHGMWRFLEVLFAEGGPLRAAFTEQSEGEAEGWKKQDQSRQPLLKAFADALLRGHVQVAVVLQRHVLSAAEVASCVSEAEVDFVSKEALARFERAAQLGAPVASMISVPSSSSSVSSASSFSTTSSSAPSASDPEREEGKKGPAPSVYLRLKDGRTVLIKGARVWE